MSSKTDCPTEGVSDFSEKVTLRFGRFGTGLVIGKIPGGVNSGSTTDGRFGIAGVVGAVPNDFSVIA